MRAGSVEVTVEVTYLYPANMFCEDTLSTLFYPLRLTGCQRACVARLQTSPNAIRQQQ